MPKKMIISAVICELNPLHLGHRAILQHSKEISDATVCILSGNFMQRGEPAILDKWARCRLALENGADLVIELPLPWACSGAEHFASGGVQLAEGLGCVNYLLFGCEEESLSKLKSTANALLSQDFSRFLAQENAPGETFARRREKALSKLLGPEYGNILQLPNNILAVEYLKALITLNSNITPKSFLRKGAGHDMSAKKNEFHSAGQLRRLMLDRENLHGLVPDSTLSLLEELITQGKCPVSINYLERAILCKLRSMKAEDFRSLPDISEGIENRLYTASQNACSLEQLYELAKTKRYTHARIRRLVISAFLGLDSSMPDSPPYLRILGMSLKGQELLKKASPTLPLAVRPEDFRRLSGQALSVFELEARSDDIYSLACPIPQPCGRDYTEKLIKL